ncbi:MAG: bifunctional glutamate N-acetyltransferase/amino-acid acetyltransferase ArgJ [Ignavibacteria bacterium]|nr:bifunctional glutamate N-acetyltransferase/amino-acid acetyltransferase ArgJ [Ignavibacteria bacterium]
MYQFIPEGTITSVQGFKSAGIFCGIKKQKKDLALIYSDTPCFAAGTFTLNKVVAAPNVISKNIIKQQNRVRAILVNSGNANACTGTKGFENALESQSYLAKKLSINPTEVIISSTGVIGLQLPIDKLLNGIDKIIPELSENGGDDSAEAILTTDLRKKSFAVKVQLQEGEVIIGGICKGSGMIMPNMATMLAFLTTDASIENTVLQKLLTNSVNETFNKISVDGETSTNDMVILLANGVSKIKVNEGTENYSTFLNGLIAICSEMAKAIVADGEGATKLITVSVNNAKTKEDANAVAKAVANSPLVKTAMNGNDANWGRILAAAGNSGVDFNPDKVTIKFDDLPVLLPNYNAGFSEDEVKRVLNKSEVTLFLDLNEGKESSTWWTCDFSENYVKINAGYRT